MFIIYGPVWSEAIAPRRLKSLWISFMLLCCPIGLTIGFAITALFTNHYKWEGSFWTISLFSAFYAFLILLVPSKYFDVNTAIEFKKVCIEKATQSVDADSEQVAEG